MISRLASAEVWRGRGLSPDGKIDSILAVSHFFI
jgi:hypothetical protein